VRHRKSKNPKLSQMDVDDRQMNREG